MEQEWGIIVRLMKTRWILATNIEIWNFIWRGCVMACSAVFSFLKLKFEFHIEFLITEICNFLLIHLLFIGSNCNDKLPCLPSNASWFTSWLHIDRVLHIYRSASSNFPIHTMLSFLPSINLGKPSLVMKQQAF